MEQIKPGAALLMEGGALRGMFTAGVLDVWMERGLHFDGAIGVSAGAAFGCNLKSRQIGRAIRYNLRFCKEPSYCSLRSLLRTGDLFGAEFCYDRIPKQLDPFDEAAYDADPMAFYVVCTDVDTGKAVYPDGYVFLPGTMVAEFENTVLSLDEFQVSDPVQSDYGWHVIMRLPLDPDGVIEYSNDGVALTARSKAANEAYGKALQDYFDSLKVEYAEGFEAPKLADYLK